MRASDASFEPWVKMSTSCDEEDVDAVDAEPLEGRLERAHHAVIAVVVDFAAGWRVEELADAGALIGRADLEQASGLGREHIFVALLAAQELVEAGLGEAEPIKRRRVVVAEAAVPGGLERGLGVLVGNGAVEIAERGGAEAELGECQSAIADAVPMPCFHGRSSIVDASGAICAG